MAQKPHKEDRDDGDEHMEGAQYDVKKPHKDAERPEKEVMKSKKDDKDILNDGDDGGDVDLCDADDAGELSKDKEGT